MKWNDQYNNSVIVIKLLILTKPSLRFSNVETLSWFTQTNLTLQCSTNTEPQIVGCKNFGGQTFVPKYDEYVKIINPSPLNTNLKDFIFFSSYEHLLQGR